MNMPVSSYKKSKIEDIAVVVAICPVSWDHAELSTP
jgi:hypothetical protein